MGFILIQFKIMNEEGFFDGDPLTDLWFWNASTIFYEL